MKRSIVVLAAFLLAAFAATQSARAGYQEAPELAAQVQAGSLPPLAERLPTTPFVDPLDRPWESIGGYGGQLRCLPRAIRLG